MITPARDDKRFKNEAWAENVVFDFFKQAYLLTSRQIQDMVEQVPGLGTVVELADAESLLTASQMDLAIGEFEVARARAQLGRAIGDGRQRAIHGTAGHWNGRPPLPLLPTTSRCFRMSRVSNPIGV